MAENGSANGKMVPPYLSFKTLKSFIERLKVAVPSRIDRSVMGSMSGAVQGQILSTLKYLSLTTEHGIPTDKLTRLVKSEGAERQKILREIITTAYPFIEMDSLPSATAKLLQDQFAATGAQGETVRKCVAFFVSAAKDCALPLSPYITEKTRGTRSANSRPRRQPGQAQTASPSTTNDDTGSQASPTSLTWTELLLSKFPSFDPSWPDEVKSKWFDGFDKLMRSGQEKEREK